MAYVYRHIRLDKNQPFYIGIGTEKYFKRARMRTKRNEVWYRIAKKTLWEVEILFEDVTLDFAKEKEKEFIAMYGRIDNGDGILANLTAGGDGLFSVSKGVKERLSRRMSGEGNPFYGKKHSLETREKIKKGQAGKERPPCSESTKIKISKANKGYPSHQKGRPNEYAYKMRGEQHFSYRGPVYCFNISGGFLKKYDSIRDAALAFNTCTNSIRRVITRERFHFKEHLFSYDSVWSSPPFKFKKGCPSPFLKNSLQ